MDNIQDLKSMRDKIKGELDATEKIRITVGMATCGIAAGASPVLEIITEEAEKQGLNTDVVKTGCIGICQFEPIVEVYIPGQEKVTYVRVDKEKAARILAEHIVGGVMVAEYTIGADIAAR